MLIDTSVWIDHLRRRDATLVALLVGAKVECHPFIVGELACGRLRRRAEILALLENLPETPFVDHTEVLTFVETHRLMGTGLGWVDAHLLASAALASTALWTRDRPLAKAARDLGLYWAP